MESEKLRELLESLPQELYDKIFEETFTAAGGTHYLVESFKFHYTEDGAAMSETASYSRFRGHDSPNLFLVSRASRLMFAKSYHASSVVVADSVLVAIRYIANQMAAYGKCTADILVDNYLHGTVLCEECWAFLDRHVKALGPGPVGRLVKESPEGAQLQVYKENEVLHHAPTALPQIKQDEHAPAWVVRSNRGFIQKYKMRLAAKTSA